MILWQLGVLLGECTRVAIHIRSLHLVLGLFPHHPSCILSTNGNAIFCNILFNFALCIIFTLHDLHFASFCTIAKCLIYTLLKIVNYVHYILNINRSKYQLNLIYSLLVESSLSFQKLAEEGELLEPNKRLRSVRRANNL